MELLYLVYQFGLFFVSINGKLSQPSLISIESDD